MSEAFLSRLLARNGVVLTLAWALVWAVAAAAGLRFETFDLSFWHFIDPAELVAAPLRSLYHLHAQPPLFNAALAAALALFGDAHALPCYLVFALMSLATVLAAAAVVTELARSRVAGLVTGLLILLSPALIAYGHVLFHALPAAFLTTTGVWAVHRAALRPGWARLALVAAIVTAAMLLWSVFHPVWLVLTTLWLVWAIDTARARVVAVMAVPLVLVAALIVKNGVVFGVWELSSWTGMNLARITVHQIPKAEREAAIAAGELSPVSRMRPFAELRRYGEVPDPAPTGIPMLDRPFKSDRAINLHHLKYIEISRRYRADALQVMRTRPVAYLRAVVKGFWLLYLHPATDFVVVDEQYKRLGLYAVIYEALIYGTPPGRERPADLRPERGWSFGRTLVASGVLLRLWFLAVLAGGPVWVVRLARAGRLRTPEGVTVTALVGAILYVTLVCSLAEIGENQRFRFTVEPAAMMVAVLGATALVRRLRRRTARRGSAASLLL